MIDQHPKIYTPNLSHSEPGDTAAYEVEELQRKLIGELKICNFQEHPNVDDELKEIIGRLPEKTGEHTIIDSDSKDKESIYLSKPLSEKAHMIMKIGKYVNLDNGEMARELDNLFIFDTESGNIADLKDIWSGNPLFQGEMAPLVISGTKVARGSSGAQLIKTWRPIITLPYLLGRSGLAYFELSKGHKAITAPHEIGHFLQMNEQPRRLYADSILDAEKSFNNMNWLKLASHLPFIGKEVIESKNEWVKTERNAHAFALNLFRRLNANGIDLKAILPQMVKSASESLNNYDVVLKGMKGDLFARGHKT